MSELFNDFVQAVKAEVAKIREEVKAEIEAIKSHFCHEVTPPVVSVATVVAEPDATTPVDVPAAPVEDHTV